MRWSFWRWKRRETDLDEEIAHDLALDAEEKVQSGKSREEAERSSSSSFCCMKPVRMKVWRPSLFLCSSASGLRSKARQRYSRSLNRHHFIQELAELLWSP